MWDKFTERIDFLFLTLADWLSPKLDKLFGRDGMRMAFIFLHIGTILICSTTIARYALQGVWPLGVLYALLWTFIHWMVNDDFKKVEATFESDVIKLSPLELRHFCARARLYSFIGAIFCLTDLVLLPFGGVTISSAGSSIGIFLVGFSHYMAVTNHKSISKSLAKRFAEKAKELASKAKDKVKLPDLVPAPVPIKV